MPPLVLQGSKKPGINRVNEGQDRNQMFQPIFVRGPWPETFKSSFSRTNQTANKRGRQKKFVRSFLNFTYPHKTQPGQKTAGNFPNFFEESTHQMFGYPDLDAGLNIRPLSIVVKGA